MARIPIEVEKIKKTNYNQLNDTSTEITEYLINVSEKGRYWNKTFRASLKDLTLLRDEITVVLENTTTAEKLGVSNEKAKKLDSHFINDPICKGCNYQLTNYCTTCIFDLQSPLERKLFIALNEEYIRYDTQYGINWKGQNISTKGKSYNNPLNNFKDVLTVVDFYIEKNGLKLCVYTDGHTYHERTEEQAQRDKRIDRKLQELGFQVLRYTGKDVNDDINNIIREIKKWLSK